MEEPGATFGCTDNAHISSDVFCPHCAYNLRGLPEGRCPECGQPFTSQSLLKSLIPWLHRHEIGLMNAWWKTCWMSFRRPSQFAASLNAPCPYRDARRFWLITVAFFWLVAVAILLLGPELPLPKLDLSSAWMGSSTSSWWAAMSLLWPWDQGLSWQVVSLSSLFLCILLPTGAASYLFQLARLPRLQQDRAAAMSLYMSGALVAGFVVSLFLLAVLSLAYAIMFRVPLQDWDLQLLRAFAAGALPISACAWIVLTARLHRLIRHAGLTAHIFISILLISGLSPLCLGLAAVAYPWLIGLVLLVWQSL